MKNAVVALKNRLLRRPPHTQSYRIGWVQNAFVPKAFLSILFLLFFTAVRAQLGFCSGSKGDPLFFENFGNGMTYGPALPAGTTTYPFIAGAPNDGFYTLYYHSSFFQPSWHYSLDHTPDATNGPNGKMLLVNANAVTSGDFYKKTVTGLCVNTTFEFSAWLLNVYNPTSNICVNQIPINVRFEIWNSTETVLLGSGNTGNIMGTPTPTWNQFALVFTTVSETSVILKMKNNGVGGCGNDLAIDDISFSACGSLTSVSSPGISGNTYSTCNSPASVQLDAVTSGATYFYQWQSSNDGITWTDVAGETGATYTPSVNSTTYFRVKAAQDAANLNNFCATTSNVFTISISGASSPAISNGDKTICSNEPIPALTVIPPSGNGVNWYDAPTGGTLLQSNSASYTPATAGTYYAETYNLITNCIGGRIPVSLAIVALPDVTISGNTSICAGNTAVVTFTGTPNAVVTYTVNAGANQTILLNSAGTATLTTPVLNASVTYALVSVSAAILPSCSQLKSDSVTINVSNSATASISAPSMVCEGNSATVSFTGTPNATVTYTVGGPNQTIVLDAVGNASIVLPNVSASVTYTLVQVAVGTCTQVLSQSVTITALPLPIASIAASDLAVCAGQSSNITFSGTPNAIVTYSVNNGPNQTISLNATGSAVLTTPALSASITYEIISVALSGSMACSVSISDSVTIGVNPLPTAAISSNSPVCQGDSATVTFTGTPNATVNFTNGGSNQSIVLNGAGSASLIIPSVTNSTVISLTAVSLGGCSQNLSQSVTVAPIQAANVMISANVTSVCSGQNAVITFSGTPSSLVTYTVNSGPNQTVTLSSSGSASLSTAITSATTFQLVNVGVAGCVQPVSGMVSISVNATPIVSYTGNLTYCDGGTTAISLSSNIPGTTFNWTAAQNGTTGATSGTGNQIAQILGLQNDVAGSVVYTITADYNGCVGNPITVTITVQPVPVPKIADGMICTTSAASPSTLFYTLNTALNDANHTFQWFFNGNLIPGAAGSTYNATQIGTYSVIATNSAGCVSQTVSATVGEMPQGESLQIQQSATFSDNPTITVTVIGGSGPFLYQLDNGPFQPSNVFFNVSDGNHVVNVIDGFCTNLSASVTIIDYPKFFTPNNDGFNDSWNIVSMDDAVIWIFDRYGKLLKQISTEGFGWDGTYNGEPMPSSDYWFAIDYIENGLSKTFKAHFALKR